jgi:hypothetical protein
MQSIDIFELRVGDTIIHNNELKTVSGKDLKRSFCGKTVFGDSYNMGTKKVVRIPPNELHKYLKYGTKDKVRVHVN